MFYVPLFWRSPLLNNLPFPSHSRSYVHPRNCCGRFYLVKGNVDKDDDGDDDFGAGGSVGVVVGSRVGV